MGPNKTQRLGWAALPHEAERGNEEPSMLRLMHFLRNESGATAIEYALIAGGISIVIVAAVNGVGSKLTATFQSIQDAIK